MSVNCVIATVKTGVVAVGRIGIYIFCSIISTNVGTGAVTVVCRSVLVAFVVYHSVVASFQVAVAMLVMSADCLAVRLRVL